MMKVHRIFLTLEIVFILFPSTIVSIFGGIYLFDMSLGEIKRRDALLSAYLLVMIPALLVSIFSLWYISIRTVRDIQNRSMRLTSSLYLLVHFGAAISILSVAATAIYYLYPGLEKALNYMVGFVYGSGALVPYLHATYLNHHANSHRRQDAAKAAAPLL